MKILVYSFNDKIGDGLQKISFIQKLRSLYPNSHITYTTTFETSFKTFLYPLIDEYIDEFIEDNQVTSSILGFFKTNLIFKDLYFDLIIDLQKVVTRTIKLKKIPHKIFFSSSANFLFSDIKNTQNYSFKKLYIERFYFNILSLLTNQFIKDIPEIIIPKCDTSNIKISSNKLNNIAIAPGAGNKIRRWNFEKYLQVGKKLREDGYNVYFFLGPDERNLLDLCLKNKFVCPEWQDGEIINKNIIFIMNLAKRMNYLLCNDGGTAWMFEFAGIKTLKIFGVTDKKKFARPGYTETIDISDFGYKTLDKFPVSEYLKLLRNFLKK
mgnify:CR=1 FL=1